MRVTPDGRLLRIGGAWTLGAALVVAWPAAWPLLPAAFLVIVALVGADLLLWRGEPSLSLRRTIPERTQVGAEAPIRLELGNPAERPLQVDLWEAVPEDLGPSRVVFQGLRVPARESLDVPYAVRPMERGDRELGALAALVRSPLGLLRERVEAGRGDTVRVYPNTSRLLRPEALQPRQILALLGVKHARRRGDGMEFDTLRDYVPGDDPRRLDWAASARRGRPVVRLFRHERNHTVMLALDASRLMAARVEGRSKLDHAIDASLALAYAALLSGDRVGMTVFDTSLRGHLSPVAHRRDLGRFIDFLRPVQPRLVEADFEGLARGLSLRQKQRALVVLFTDFVEVDPENLRRSLGLLARRHRVLMVALRDPLYAEVETGDTRERGRDGLYRRIVLDDLLHEREITLASLRRLGLQTLDLSPEAAIAPVLNRYLAIRYGPER